MLTAGGSPARKVRVHGTSEGNWNSGHTDSPHSRVVAFCMIQNIQMDVPEVRHPEGSCETVIVLVG